jgi:hypothetical protein
MPYTWPYSFPSDSPISVAQGILSRSLRKSGHLNNEAGSADFLFFEVCGFSVEILERTAELQISG